ncbi:MAG: FkbM family methyltransferase [Nitrospirae bacterium]|nr:FkbM family methyltransferase [Nitrospirota bacterium]MBF0535796.1 FkbM family methyltransferase [Nitrospirota bacterium]MBF0617663.1 FkbM family methyltransferase [Nitrospirota bacterium]
MGISLNIVDAGARYGIHPSLDELKDCADFYLFEIDKPEAQRLSEKYKRFKNINVYNLGLYSSNSINKMNMTRHPGLTSFLDVDKAVVDSLDYMKEESSVVSVTEIECVALDEFLTNDIHFMKLDTEGTELEILKGATGHLKKDIIGIRAETRIRPFYKGQAFVWDINHLLLTFGFELINIGYEGRGIKKSKFTLPDKYGIVGGFDAVWTKKKSLLLDTSLYSDDEIRANTIRTAIFYMLNNATDCALDILIHTVDSLGLTFEKYMEDPIFLHLMKQVEKLFYYLVRLPYFERKELDAIFAKIFYKGMKFSFYQQ